MIGVSSSSLQRGLLAALVIAALPAGVHAQAPDLLPALALERIVRAGRQLDAGQLPAALKTLREGKEAPADEALARSLRATTLEGLILLRLGRLSEGRARLEQVTASEGVPAGLRRLIAFEQARILRGDGELEAALELYETIPFGSWHWFEAREAEIDLLTSQGKLEAACALAAELAGELRHERREPTAFLRLARCLEREARRHARRGDADAARRRLAEARGLYRAVVILWPRSAATAPLGRQGLERLAEKEDLPPFSLEAEDLLERARRMAAIAHPRYTRQVLLGLRTELASRASRAARTELDLLLGENAFRLRRFKRAWRWLESARKLAPDPELEGRAMLGLGRLRARAGRHLALETYHEVADRYPGEEVGLHALDQGAESARRLGDLAQARKILRTCLERAEALGASDHLLLCRWRLAWLEHLDGDTEAALELIGREDEPLVSSPERPIDPALEGRIRYWRGRWQELAGDREAWRETHRRLAADQPMQIYGLLARRRLADAGVIVDSPLLEVRSDPPSARLHPAVAEAVELHAMGLRRDARLALGSLNRETVDGDSRRIAARLMEQGGELPRSHRMAPLPWTGGLEEPPPIDREAARLSYPRAFAAVVESERRDERVDPELLWALMRNESGFDPKAHSTAGARGLTQMLLSTARSVARRHKQGAVQGWQLYDPEIAVTLGSAYLGDLLARFDGHLGLALASYNAGEAAVDRWRWQYRGWTFDVLMEEIPFEETRRYVGRVITFYAMYRLLGGGELGELPLDLKTPLTGKAPPQP
ncbi:MAG: transglycosylase SLT domain-containing protein [Deltaproteobacteria bacterium]|nr:transglycosylase SLT domain-containing protein [Deltaproteobacteria bacterium]